MIQKLIEVLDLANNEEINEIYDEVFDKRIHIANYINAYLKGRLHEFDDIINIHIIFSKLQEVYDE